MINLAETFPSDLNAPGAWSFEARYRVHDGYGRLKGEGNTIAEAIENGFERNRDGSIDEAWSEDHWELNWLSYNGQRISDISGTALRAAEQSLLGIQDFSATAAMASAVRAFQEAHEVRQRVTILKRALLPMLVARNER